MAITLPSHILEAKHRLAEGRQKLSEKHRSGVPGHQIGAHLTDVIDGIVSQVFDAALEDLQLPSLRRHVALVSHGGYGRRDLAPFSDVDLMILFAPPSGENITQLARRLMGDLFDTGLTLAQSVRSPLEACQLAMGDAMIATSLMESRFLAGSVSLYTEFFQRFQRKLQGSQRRLFAAIEKARYEERDQYGGTVYLLEPNVKRSPGGLRDIHFMRWCGFLRYGTSEPDNLLLAGAFSPEDHRLLRDAGEFLLRLRHEMHFHANIPQDLLTRLEQVRVADAFGYAEQPPILPVERFMRDYFAHTQFVMQLARRIVESNRPGARARRMMRLMASHQVEREFLVSPSFIDATRRGKQRLSESLGQILRLADLANLYNKRIGHETWEHIRRSISQIDDELTPEAIQHFLSLMARPTRLYELVHALHQVGVLEKVIPQFAHARCLLQFNEYHKYTVDEHSLRTIKHVASFREDTGLLGHVYNSLKKKRTLHLALLLHDLGKGYDEDHSEVGARIAMDVANRLRLPADEADTIQFLVHKHLMMSHLAFRRDTSDEQLVIRFAVEVGSPDVLRMLFLLTAADLAAVGPGMLNNWKVEVLCELFERAMMHLAGETTSFDSEYRYGALRREILQALPPETEQATLEKLVKELRPSVLRADIPENTAKLLHTLVDLPRGETVVQFHFTPQSGTLAIQVGAHEAITDGIFHKIAGVLSSHRLQVLSAEINTFSNGLILDTFFVIDPDHVGEPPLERLESIERALRQCLRDPGDASPKFVPLWSSRPASQQLEIEKAARLPTRVRTDNDTSEKFTIIDVFAHDRPGLLYALAHALYDLKLSLRVAKIGTHLDQVVDVFYVTEEDGGKVELPERLAEIKERIHHEVDKLQHSA